MYLASLLACLAPPAPEGWDKDITQLQHTHTPLPSRRLLTLILLNTFSALLLFLSLSPSRTCLPLGYSRCLIRLGPRPSPPAPEGWDKDINTIKVNTTPLRVYTLTLLPVSNTSSGPFRYHTSRHTHPEVAALIVPVADSYHPDLAPPRPRRVGIKTPREHNPILLSQCE